MKSVLSLLTVLALCFASAEPFVWPDAWTAAPGEGTQGSTIRSSTLSGSRTFNPFVVSEENVVMARSFYSTPLIMRDYSNRQWIPYAAESFALSDDGLSAVVTLRPEVTWSDGEPVTADDYIFYYTAITDEEIGSARAEDFMIGDEVVGIEKTGEPQFGKGVES